MSIDLKGLCDDALGIVFQYCDKASLFAMARSNKLLYKVSDSPMAFQYLPVVRIDPDGIKQLVKVPRGRHFSALRIENQDPLGTIFPISYEIGWVSYAIRYMTRLRALTLNNLKMDPLVDMFPLWDSFTNLPYLISLSLRRCQIGDEGMKALAPKLRNLPSLEYLDLQCNNLHKEGGEALIEAIKSLTALSTLILSGNKIDLGTLTSLAEALSHLPNITSFHSGYYIHPGATQYELEAGNELIESITKIKGLRSLSLMDTRIHTINVSQLIMALPDLVALCLGDGRLKLEVEPMSYISQIEILYLWSDLTADGLAIILRTCPYLQGLSLRNPPYLGANITFKETLSNLETLGLNMSPDRFSEGRSQYVYKAFSGLPALQTLEIINSQWDWESPLEDFLPLLESYPCLTCLELNNVLYRPEDRDNLIRFLTEHPKIQCQVPEAQMPSDPDIDRFLPLE